MPNARQKQVASTAGVTLAAMVIAAASSSVALRTAATVPLVLFIPGFCILQATHVLLRTKLQAIALSSGLSMAIAVLGGLVLNLFDGLSTTGWAVLLGGVAIVASTFSYIHMADTKCTGALNSPSRLSRLHVAMYVAAAAATLTSLGLARVGAAKHQEYAFTEFWLVPKGSVNANLVTIGIRNAEKVPTNYDIALFADNATVARRPGVRLLPGESWSDDFALNGSLARAERVQAWLFRSEAPQDVYRKVWLSRPAAPNALMTKDQR